MRFSVVLNDNSGFEKKIFSEITNKLIVLSFHSSKFTPVVSSEKDNGVNTTEIRSVLIFILDIQFSLESSIHF